MSSHLVFLAPPDEGMIKTSHILKIQAKSCSCYGPRRLILTAAGEVLSVSQSQDQSLSLSPLRVPLSISFISVSPSTALLISAEGQSFVMGSDEKSLGVLGIPGLSQSEEPLLIPGLLEKKAKTGSISQTHGAIIDEAGRVYTWGTLLGERSEPNHLESSSLYTGSQVVCGDSYTCVCTSGGYVYIYGALDSAHTRFKDSMNPALKSYKLNRPLLSARKPTQAFSLPELEHLFVSEIHRGEGFLVVVTDDGEVFAFDSCQDIIKLPLEPGVVVKSLVVSGSTIYGISYHNKVMYRWREPETITLIEQVGCGLCGWTGSAFTVSPHINKLETSDGCFLIDGELEENEALAVYASQIHSYKRSEYAQRLIDSVYREHPTQAFRQSKESYEDLDRLYAIGDNTLTIESIIKCRIEYSQREKLLKAFKPIVYPGLQRYIEKVKEYGNMKWIHKMTFAATSIPSVLSKVSQRLQVTCMSYGFQALKTSRLYSSSCSVTLNETEEAVKSIFYTITGALFRVTLHSFSYLKDLELQSLQKHTSVLSMKEVSNHILARVLRHRIGQWKTFSIIKQNKTKACERFKDSLVAIIYQGFFSLKNRAIIQELRLEALRRIVYGFNRSFGLRALKPNFDIWKKTAIERKVESINRKYRLRISVNSMFLRISYALKRSYRTAFNSLASSLVTESKMGLLILFSALSRHLSRQEYNAFKKIKGYVRLQNTGKESQTEPISSCVFVVLACQRAVDRQKLGYFGLFMNKLKKSKTSDRTLSLRDVFGSQNYTDLKKRNSLRKGKSIANQMNTKNIEKYTLAAYQQRLVKKYADIARTVEIPKNEKPPWKPSGTNIYHNSIRSVVSPTARRQEYDRFLRDRLSYSQCRPFTEKSEVSEEHEAFKENEDSQKQLIYRLALSSVDMVCDKLIYDRLINSFSKLKKFKGHDRKLFRFIKTIR